ncbi:MAG TPA: serine hydrolase [Gemmatimonadaceae bacterium]|nr:serine hydrolase [Gemmatimonadaceae bacterium]
MSRSVLSAGLAAVLLAAPASAQDRTARVDSIFGFATAATPGCAAGASQRGTVLVDRAYGLANVERGVPLSQRSRFDIGSTQKQFTAASVLLLAEEGRLSLSDDIRKHLPQLPDLGHVVTVDNLLTHTGGIRDWTGLLPMAPEGTDVASLLQRQRGLNFAPGTEWSYSNGGYELAKTLVARVSGMSFAEFAKKRLFEPLGMTSSAYVPDIMQAGPDAAMGYQKEGTGWKPYMRLGNNRGGGAIVSTIADLIRWQDALTSGKLGKFVTTKLQEPVTLASGRKLRYARGLMVDSTPGGLVVSHSGGAAGFSTWMGRVPEHGLSVVVACNFDPVSATALGGRVADVFLPPVDPSWKRPAPVAMAGVDPSGRAGLFFEERTGEPMRLGMSNGRLMIANGPPLVPVSASSFRPPRADLFFRSQDDFTLTFPDPDHLEIRSMEGQVTRYRRAQAWTPTAADVQAVEGRYESTELGSVFEIVPGPDALTMRLESAPERSLQLTPVERDTYMLRMMIVRFRRDASGKVTGFDYGNPVVRQIAFMRVGKRRAASAAPSLPVAKDAVPVAAPRLDGLVGVYEFAPGRTLTVTLDGGRLHGQTTGGQVRAMTHVSGTTFAAEGTPITVTFAVGADGRATGATMRQGEMERTLTRVP